MQDGEGQAMEISFRELKCKDVVNIVDGRNLGRANDIVFTYPHGCILGIAVPGKRGWNCFKRNDLFIPLKNIIKIGADVVLVDLRNSKLLENFHKVQKRNDRNYSLQMEYMEQETPTCRRDFSEYE